MNITEPKINDYILKTMPHRDAVQKEMEAYARRHDFPIIGPMVGRFLRQLVMITGAKRIFEMGSGYGYSAYWFAGGLQDGGKVICTDHSDDNRTRAMEYMKRGGLDSRIEFLVGDALEILRGTEGTFDIILNDIDKEHYPEALEEAEKRLREGGVFITDNVLWSGRILHKKPDASSRAILSFNRKLFASKNMFSSIIPIRDGIALAIKTS